MTTGSGRAAEPLQRHRGMLVTIMSVDVAPKRPKTARSHRDGGPAAPAPVRTRPPRILNVVSDPAPEEIGAAIDWSGWYLTEEEDMGQSAEQGKVIRAFTSALEMHALERSWESVHIGIGQFVAWVEEEPLVRVSPDVYLLDNPPAEPLPKMWELWRPGIAPPRFALEIVSEDWKKDYEQNPPKYAQLGAQELCIFDPEAARDSAPEPSRMALQIYRREADGSFVRAEKGDGPVRSEELSAWLVVRFEGLAVRLRIARDPAGLDLVPTQEEARIEAEQRGRQEQKAREEAEKQQAEAQQKLSEAKQKLSETRQKLSEVLAELERLHKQSGQ